MNDVGQDETVEHLLLECSRYTDDRREMMSVLRREIGTEGWEELIGSGTGTVMEVILGLSCGNVQGTQMTGGK